MITYHVGTQGLDTRLDPSLIMRDETFWSQDLPANVSWQEVRVKSEKDFDKWIDLKNKWLEANWSPNQSWEEKEENVVISQKCEREMRKLMV